MLAFLNDTLVPMEEARVPVMDRGFLYGDAVFETMAVYEGRPFRLDRHLARLVEACRAVSISLPCSADMMEQRILRTIEANRLENGLVRFSLTRGRSTRGLDTRGCSDPTFLVLCFPPKPPPASLRRGGATVEVSSWRRIPSRCLPSGAKTANYLNNILAFREAAERGAQEALMLTLDDEVAEGTVSNFFFVRKGLLLTPPLDLGILPGITRLVVLEAAERLGIVVRECRFRLEDLAAFDEAFYTNSNVVMMPAGVIDEYRFQVPGVVTQALQKEVARLILEEAGHCWAFDGSS
ncbi:MAG: branched-chain amino acid aminotransferase [Alphaproteobacteria bacterium]|nr:MAG: branched-chain amino acid aminotransferase [Alphaproteobacteria bacterium]